jgi:hypothetical protein
MILTNMTFSQCSTQCHFPPHWCSWSQCAAVRGAAPQATRRRRQQQRCDERNQQSTDPTTNLDPLHSHRPHLHWKDVAKRIYSRLATNASSIVGRRCCLCHHRVAGQWAAADARTAARWSWHRRIDPMSRHYCSSTSMSMHYASSIRSPPTTRCSSFDLSCRAVSAREQPK